MTLGHLIAVGYAVAAFPLRVLLPAEHGRATVRQEKDSEPLSMEYMTMEFSSMPSSLSLARTSSQWPSCLTRPSV